MGGGGREEKSWEKNGGDSSDRNAAFDVDISSDLMSAGAIATSTTEDADDAESATGTAAASQGLCSNGVVGSSSGRKVFATKASCTSDTFEAPFSLPLPDTDHFFALSALRKSPKLRRFNLGDGIIVAERGACCSRGWLASFMARILGERLIFWGLGAEATIASAEAWAITFLDGE